jgi:small acid-soluble spore protein F (minor alpha/beta-type SASP)
MGLAFVNLGTCKNFDLFTTIEGGYIMSKHHSTMSEELKNELAREIGVYDTVKNEGWGAVSSRDCGNMVAAAIRFADRMVREQNSIH